MYMIIIERSYVLQNQKNENKIFYIYRLCKITHMPNFDIGTFVQGILVKELNIILYCYAQNRFA